MFKIFHKKIKENSSRGFTLIEMTVVAGIFGLLTAIVVFKYGDFTSNMLVTNMAYEIALTTRQAQVFGVGVRGYVDSEGATDFQYPYGVYFNLNDGSASDGTRNFILFADRDNDQICDDGTGQSAIHACTCSAGDECLNRLTLQRNIRITEIRLGGTTGIACTNDPGVNVSATVTFKRPSPEARIKRQDDLDDGYSFLQVKVEAPGTNVNPSYVLIRKNGQISVSGDSICSRYYPPEE